MPLKSEVIQRAYAQIRISGLTSNPNPEEVNIAVIELENMMHEWKSRAIDVGYLFTTEEYDPDPNEESNIPPWAVGGVTSSLAMRLPDYFSSEKDISNSIMRKAKAGLTVIKNNTWAANDVAYPSRTPRGSGNTSRGYYYYRWYPKQFNPKTDSVNTLYFGDINNYFVDFKSYLVGDEIISSVDFRADNGLSVTIDSVTDDRINYTVEALANGGENLNVQFSITTDQGRKTTRDVFFTIIPKSVDNA